MKNRLLLFIILAFSMLAVMSYFESKKDPYEIGGHMDYVIICENGFVYKETNHSTIQVFNSDGTPLKCGHKIY